MFRFDVSTSSVMSTEGFAKAIEDIVLPRAIERPHRQ